MFRRLLFIAVLAFSLQSCGSVKPSADQFFRAVVDCSMVNPSSSAAAGAVLSCLENAISGDPSSCLLGLVVEAHWTVDEIACIVRTLGADSNKKLLEGGGAPRDLAVARSARNWLIGEGIGFR